MHVPIPHEFCVEQRHDTILHLHHPIVCMQTPKDHHAVTYVHDLIFKLVTRFCYAKHNGLIKYSPAVLFSSYSQCLITNGGTPVKITITSFLLVFSLVFLDDSVGIELSLISTFLHIISRLWSLQWRNTSISLAFSPSQIPPHTHTHTHTRTHTHTHARTHARTHSTSRHSTYHGNPADATNAVLHSHQVVKHLTSSVPITVALNKNG